jgi:hypothetical protein
MGFKPECARSRKRIYPSVPPPRSFLPAAMNLTMMRPAQGHRELIAHLPTERTRLRKAQVVGIGRPPTANQTGLFDDMPNMIAVTNAARFGKDQDTLVDLRCASRLEQSLIAGSSRRVTGFWFFCRDPCQFGGKRFLKPPGIGRRQLVLCHQPALCPHCRIISGVELFDLAEQFGC